jgi:hypothetical protein
MYFVPRPQGHGSLLLKGFGERSDLFLKAQYMHSKGQANEYVPYILNSVVECLDFQEFLKVAETECTKPSGGQESNEVIVNFLGEGVVYFLQRIGGIDAQSLANGFKGHIETRMTRSSLCAAIGKMRAMVRSCVSMNWVVLETACRMRKGVN